MEDDYDTIYGKEEFSMWSSLSPGAVLQVLENYGWHLLFAFILLIIVYNKVLKSYLEKYRSLKFEREYAAKYHKNPDIIAQTVNAQQQWIQKMQEKYNKESEKHQEKMKAKEEKRREELINKYGSLGGSVLGRNTKDNTFKPDYNPLMGDTSSSSYRPPRRSPCGGGGCGR